MQKEVLDNIRGAKEFNPVTRDGQKHDHNKQ